MSSPVCGTARARLARDVSGEAQPAQRLTERLRETIEFVEEDLTIGLRRCVPDALLGIALARLIARDGRHAAAAILTNFAEVILSDAVLSLERPTRRDRTAHHRAEPAGDNPVVRLR